MAFLFPGVYSREIDKSDYIAQAATTALGLVGVANKGPLHVPTLITNEQELVDTFGAPPRTSGGTNEKQVITVTAGSSGTYTLTYAGQTTTTIAYNATAATVQTALRALPAIGSTGVNVSGNAGGPWTVEFAGTLASRNVSALTYSSGTLTIAITTLIVGTTPPGDFAMLAAMFYLSRGRALWFTRTCQYDSNSGWLATTGSTPAAASAGAVKWDQGNEVQVVNLDSATAGQFKLTYNAVQSGDISANADAATVQAALEAVSTIGTGNVEVTGAPRGPYSVKFKGTLGGTNVSLMTIANGTTSLSGGGGSPTVTESVAGGSPLAIVFSANSPGDWGNDLRVRFTKVDGVYSSEEQLIYLNGASAGQFRLTYRGVQTGDIAYNASASAIQTALEAINTIGTGNVAVTILSSGRIKVSFQGTLASTDLPIMTFSNGTTPLSGGSTTDRGVTEYTQGGVPVPGKTVYRMDVLTPVDVTGTTVDVVESFDRVMLVNDTDLLSAMNAHWLADAIIDGIRNNLPKSKQVTVVKTDFPAAYTDVKEELATDAQTTGATYTFSGGYSALNTSAGTSDDYAAAYIGTEVDVTYGPTALQTFINPQRVNINLLAVPGVGNDDVLTELIRVCEVRQDCMCIIDPPSGLTHSEVVRWHNKQSEWAVDGFKPNSSFAALYWPWIRAYDPYNRQEVVLPPSCFIPGQYALTDLLTAPWFAPAGLKRGRVERALALESPTPSLGALENMYSGGNVINPIMDFTNDGITIFGQRTTQRRPTALDRVNVRRLLLYIERAVTNAIRFLVFEPNDDQTRNEFVNLITPFLQTIKNSRGLYDFQVICDETTNPPSVIDQNQLKGVILLKPVKTAEIITVDFTLLSTGAEFQVSGESRA